MFSTLFRRAREAKSAVIDLDKWSWLSWPTTKSGVRMSDSVALEVSAVLACVRLISQDVASLPLSVYRVGEGGRRTPAPDAPAARLLGRRPNAWQTSFEFRETMTAHALLSGDAVAVLGRGVDGNVTEMRPLMPGTFTVERLRDWSLRYHVGDAGTGTTRVFLPSEVLHIRNLSWDGYRGLKISSVARETIALAYAASGAQAMQLGNGGKPQGVLSTDQTLKPEQLQRLRDGWKAATGGGNSYSTPVLDAGLKFQPTSMTSVDQEVVATRKHQIIEICATFGVAPAVLGIDDRTQAFASVEAMQRWHLTHTLRPWLTRWEQALDRDVLDDDGPLFATFDTREMTRATTKERSESYRTQVELGIMTRNEAREEEGRQPLDGLDAPLTPLNTREGRDETAPD